jgi:hypothetical protein
VNEQRSIGHCFFEVVLDEDLRFTPARCYESISPKYVLLDVPGEERVTATFIFLATT